MYNLIDRNVKPLESVKGKITYMKLNTFLNSLVGKELSTSDVQAVMEMTTDIKTKAVDKLQTELTELKGKYETVTKELETFTDAKDDAELKEAYIEAGGNPDKFESFKKVTGKVENLKDVKFEETFKEFPGLKQETAGEVEGNPFGSSSNLANIKSSEVEGKGGNSLPATDDMGLGEDSLIS